MKKRGKATSFILTVALVLTTVCVPITALAAESTALNPAKVTVTNNANETKDVIYITSGTRSGDVITVYGGTTSFKSGTARGASFRFELPAGILDDMNDGTIELTVTGMGKTESARVPVGYKAAPKSLEPILNNIVVTNNVQTPGGTVYDRVNITGLRSGDVFYVYDQVPAATGGTTPIGSSSTATTKGVAEAVLKKDLPDAGIWITVKSTGRTESDPVPVAVGGVDTTKDNKITAAAINNYGASDKIMITGLYPGDEVQAREESTGVIYGSGRVAQKKTDIEISAKANRTGLIPSGGSIMIKVTTIGKETIEVGPFSYDSELVSNPVSVAAQSEFNGNKTSCGSVTIYNYENKSDQIEITDLLPGDKILITSNPEPPQNEMQLKTGAVGNASTVFKSTLRLPDIPKESSTGSIKIYVTSIGMERSNPVVVEYTISLRSEEPSAPGATTAAGVAIVAVTNSAVKNGDSILVTGVEKGDQIKIYENEERPANGKETVLNAQSSGTVSGSKTEVIVFAQFPTATDGKVYVSYMKPGLQESNRVEVAYGPEKQTSLSGISFVAFNTAGDKDTLTITGAPKNALVQAYTTAGATAIKGSYIKIKNDTAETVATFAFPKIPTDAAPGSGVIYVGVTIPGESESDLIEVQYDPEPLQGRDTTKLTAQAINVFGPLDYVIFTQPVIPTSYTQSADMTGTGIGLPTKDNLYPGHTLSTPRTVITLYASMDTTVKTKLGSLTIGSQDARKQAAGGDYYLERTVNTKALDPKGGTIAYTLTYPGKAESERFPLTYLGENQTEAISDSAVQVTNNINTGTMPDYIDANTGGIVTTGSIIKVYSEADAKAKVLGKVTVTAKMTSEAAVRISLTGKNILGPDAGSVWVTVQELGKSESGFVEIKYLAEGAVQTPDISALTPPSSGGIYAVGVDNGGTTAKDFIFVFGLAPDDTVTLTYKASAASAKDTVRSVKVTAGQSTATFNITIPDDGWSNGYITVTRKGMSESAPTNLSAIRVAGIQ